MPVPGVDAASCAAARRLFAVRVAATALPRVGAADGPQSWIAAHPAHHRRTRTVLGSYAQEPYRFPKQDVWKRAFAARFTPHHLAAARAAPGEPDAAGCGRCRWAPAISRPWFRTSDLPYPSGSRPSGVRETTG